MVSAAGVAPPAIIGQFSVPKCWSHKCPNPDNYTFTGTKRVPIWSRVIIPTTGWPIFNKSGVFFLQKLLRVIEIRPPLIETSNTNEADKPRMRSHETPTTCWPVELIRISYACHCDVHHACTITGLIPTVSFHLRTLTQISLILYWVCCYLRCIDPSFPLQIS
jgi:hypothetical protein